METLNTILGIVASALSIGAIIFSKKTSDRNKEIEKILNQTLNINTGSIESRTVKKAKSGKQGTSIIGDSNKVSGGKE